ncbi:MAG: cytochrome c [Chryseosolibacter sp.]
MKICKMIMTVMVMGITSDLPAQDSHDVEASFARGKMIYEQHCLACHQADGSGVPNLAPPLIKGVFVNGDTQRLVNIVLDGLEGVEIKGEYYANPMPAFDYLSDEEIADVLTYVRTGFSNTAGALTKEVVAQARNKK